MVIHDRLTDYQIAEAFGNTLSLIYKDKMKELNDDLAEAFAHLDSLAIPQVSEFERWYAAEMITTVYDNIRRDFKAIEHIQKIRRMYKLMKNQSENNVQSLNIEKAKSVSILSFYTPEKQKGRQITCPFHIDKSPSMLMNKNRTVKCFSCGFFGDSISVWMKLYGDSFRDAVCKLGEL